MKISKQFAILLISLVLVVRASADADVSYRDAVAIQSELWEKRMVTLRQERSAEMQAGQAQIGEHTMRYQSTTYGKKPKKGWDLFISLHGGGAVPEAVNNSQWLHQLKMGDSYLPQNAIYIAPRATTDQWNLWHQEHVDDLLSRLIENFVALKNVNPNRVYLIGYSAGGNGVYKLAPRLADRLAGAGTMAGQPRDASPLGLRNVAFSIDVGENDAAYERNASALEWRKSLEKLQNEDPKSYQHRVRIHEDKSHWLDFAEKDSISWLQKFSRNPIPDRVVWYQDEVTEDSYYWLALPQGDARQDQCVAATITGQTIRIEVVEGIETLLIRLNDQMLDLDREITVLNSDGTKSFSGLVKRSKKLAEETLEKGDNSLVFWGEIQITFHKKWSHQKLKGR